MHEHLTALETRIRALLSRESDLPVQVGDHVTSYVDAGEYGLSLDTLGDWLVEHGLPASRALLDETASLCKVMGAPPRNIDFLRARQVRDA
jgi:hypothetical protein